MSEHDVDDGADAMDFSATDFEQLIPLLIGAVEDFDEMMADSTDRYRPFTVNIEIEFPEGEDDE